MVRSAVRLRDGSSGGVRMRWSGREERESLHSAGESLSRDPEG